jgi:hypothetical protein
MQSDSFLAYLNQLTRTEMESWTRTSFRQLSRTPDSHYRTAAFPSSLTIWIATTMVMSLSTNGGQFISFSYLRVHFPFYFLKNSLWMSVAHPVRCSQPMTDPQSFWRGTNHITSCAKPKRRHAGIQLRPLPQVEISFGAFST